MKRFIVSTAIALLAMSFTFDAEVAWSQAGSDLKQAAVEGNLDRVKELVGQGADVNVRERMGMTPLIVAAMYSHTAVCEFLMSNGADLNAKDRTGQTALFFAVKQNNRELIELLVKKGADVNATTWGGENAFSLAKKSGNTELVDFLAKNGAKDPVVVDPYGDELYGAEGMRPGAPGASPPTGATRGFSQAADEVDLLADPNEITARLKTFPGLEKAIVDLAAKSSTEMRYWAQTRTDNRTMLARAVQKQLDDEFALVRKIAVEEKATKTTEALDTMLAKKKDRDSEVRAALVQQRKEAMAGNSLRGGRSRGSTRSSGRTGGRGYSSGYATGRSSGGYVAGTGSAGDAYGGYEDAAATGVTGRGGRMSARPPEQLDPDTEEEIGLWEQATPDKKLELAKSLHPLIYGDFASIRKVAVEEEAKKTTAAIDGILLSRQVRFDVYVKMAETLKNAAAQAQAGAADDPRMQSGVRARGGRTRGGVGGTQQQMQGRRRGRR